MLERFQGDAGKPLLVEAIRTQGFVEGNVESAESLANIADLQEFEPGSLIIEQGADDNDILLILMGSVSVLVNGRLVAVRGVGQHVGEMALIDPRHTRSATVVTREQCVVARVVERDFSVIAQRNPRIWRILAMEMGKRLRQRSDLVRPKNDRPILFIGCSTESLSVAREVQAGLNYDDMDTRIWSEPNIFSASSYPMEALEGQLEEADFALLVIGADDQVLSRGKTEDAPRDNVILELGLFIGAISRARTFMLQPRGADLKIPSDLLGLTPLTYEMVDAARLASSLGPAINSIRKVVCSLGSR